MMKSRAPLSRPWTKALLPAVAVFVASDPVASPAELFEIAADQDSVVDSLVPFPFQGLNGNIWVTYDPTFGPSISRTYIRFPLAEIAGFEARVVEARLDVVTDFVSGSGGIIDVHRSENDTWPENGINFGNQPGFEPQRLASVLFNNTIVRSFQLDLQQWRPAEDARDGFVTFCLKTRETERVDTIRFRSLQGGPPPMLVLSTVRRGAVANGGFGQMLENWSPAGNVSVTTDPGNPANSAALLRTGSPASIEQRVDTHRAAFGIEFDAQFLTTTGDLTVMVGDTPVGHFPAPAELAPNLEREGIVVTASALRGLDGVPLRFVLDGPDGPTSEMLLDNIQMRTVPEPGLTVRLDQSRQNAVLEFVAETGLDYQLRRSTDLERWENHGEIIHGDGGDFQEIVPVGLGPEFFQLAFLFPDPGDPIPLEIENAGFELSMLVDGANTTDVAGWSTQPGSGAWNPTVAQYPGEAPEGSNVAYVQNNNVITQTLGEPLLAGRSYRLTALAGKRTDIGHADAIAPDIYLRVGGERLTASDSSSPSPSPGQFTTWTREYTVDPGHPGVGSPIEIVLDGGGALAPAQINFDQVSLLLMPAASGPAQLGVANAGFELPVLVGDGANTTSVPDWITEPGSGAFNPGPAQYPGEAPEGSNVAFVANNNKMRQVLGASLEADKTYALTARAGKRSDIGYSNLTPPDLHLSVAGQTLTPVSSSTPIAPPGQFTTWTREYVVTPGHPGIGSLIEIVLDGGTSSIPAQVNFDLVTLTAE